MQPAACVYRKSIIALNYRRPFGDVTVARCLVVKPAPNMSQQQAVGPRSGSWWRSAVDVTVEDSGGGDINIALGSKGSPHTDGQQQTATTLPLPLPPTVQTHRTSAQLRAQCRTLAVNQTVEITVNPLITAHIRAHNATVTCEYFYFHNVCFGKSKQCECR